LPAQIVRVTEPLQASVAERRIALQRDTFPHGAARLRKLTRIIRNPGGREDLSEQVLAKPRAGGRQSASEVPAMCTAQQYRAKAAEYKERADMAFTADAKRELQDLERSFSTLADNEQWLSNNHDKTVHAPVLPIAASTLSTTHTSCDVARQA